MLNSPVHIVFSQFTTNTYMLQLAGVAPNAGRRRRVELVRQTTPRLLLHLDGHGVCPLIVYVGVLASQVR